MRSPLDALSLSNVPQVIAFLIDKNVWHYSATKIYDSLRKFPKVTFKSDEMPSPTQRSYKEQVCIWGGEGSGETEFKDATMSYDFYPLD